MPLVNGLKASCYGFAYAKAQLSPLGLLQTSEQMYNMASGINNAHPWWHFSASKWLPEMLKY